MVNFKRRVCSVYLCWGDPFLPSQASSQHTEHTSMKQRLSVKFSKFVFNSLAALFPGLTPPIERLLHHLVTWYWPRVYQENETYNCNCDVSWPPRCLCLLTALEQVTLWILSPPHPQCPPVTAPPPLGCGLWSLCINAKSQGSAAACGNPFVLSYPPGAAQQRPANRHSDQIKSRDCTAVTAAASEMVSCSSPPRQANVTYLDFYWCSIGINYLY